MMLKILLLYIFPSMGKISNSLQLSCEVLRLSFLHALLECGSGCDLPGGVVGGSTNPFALFDPVLMHYK